MMSVKLEHVLDNLSSNYMPFTLLSKERVTELVNVVRFMELREGEIHHREPQAVDHIDQDGDRRITEDRMQKPPGIDAAVQGQFQDMLFKERCEVTLHKRNFFLRDGLLV